MFHKVVLYICVLLSLLLVFYVSQALFCISVLWFPYYWYFMYDKHCFVYLCSAFPIIGILCFTSVVLYIFVLLSLLMLFYVSQALFCISVLWFPYYLYFMYHKRCFVYLCSAFPIIGILCCHKRCFVYLCYDFPIIGILCLTSVVLYICVMISLLLVFYVSQALFCISVLWISLIGILCFTSVVLYICVLLSLLLVFYVWQVLFCISLLWFPYYWYFMSHKRCFVYLCYDFPIIDILCFTSVVLYICVMISLLLVFYALQELFCISVFCFPYYWYFIVVLYICVMISLYIGILLVFYVSQALFCISVFCFPYYWYFMFHKRCFVYLCYDFPIIDILCFTSVVLYICVIISL